jgi:hypothetical protein
VFLVGEELRIGGGDGGFEDVHERDWRLEN